MRIINIAICEDESRILEYIHMEMRSAFEIMDNSIEFDCFIGGNDLLYNIDNGIEYDILFLDIQMPEINGIDLCKKIREKNNDVIIIFISSKEELVFQTFEVRPFRFIRKNHFKDELPNLVRDIEREIEKKECRYITVKELHSSNIYCFDINNIIYIEAMGKFCNVVTIDGANKIRYKLSAFKETLNNNGFLQPHRSYLVNYQFVSTIDKCDIILDNKENIPLSRNKNEIIKKEFIKLVGN